MIVGIEIQRERLLGVAFGRYAPDHAPERTAEVPLSPAPGGEESTPERLAGPLARLMQELDAQEGMVAVAIPSRWCMFRTVALPYRNGARVEGTLRFALENRLPVVKYQRGRVQFQFGIGLDARVIPTVLSPMLHVEKVVGKKSPETQPAFIIGPGFSLGRFQTEYL